MPTEDIAGISEESKHDFVIDVEITHSNYSGQFVPDKKRWVVERTFAWLENSGDYAETMK